MSLFHKRLKELKDSSGKTQTEIAESLNITPQALSYYFNGREPSYDLLVKIADYFSVSLDYLFGRDTINFEQPNNPLSVEEMNKIKEFLDYLRLNERDFHKISAKISK